MRRRSPAGNFLVGAMVGGAVARHSAASSQQRAQAQYQQTQLTQAQIAQAQAEANYANAQAQLMQQQQSIPVAQPVAPYPPPPPPLPQPQQQQQLGRSMINECLSDNNSGSVEAQQLIALKQQLNVTQIMCDKALEMYNQSMELNRAAQRSNLGGAVLGTMTRGQTVDLIVDQKRNAQMRASIQPAERASQMLVDGFRKIPDGLRLRYPSEMSQVGNVPAARLKVGSFGRDLLMGAAFGQSGQNMNDVMMAKRIADNQREIGACIQVVREQIQLMRIVQARLDQDIAHAQNGARATAAVPMTTVVAPPPPPARPMPPPPAIRPAPSGIQLVLRAAHIVDEVAMAPYGIISVPMGAIVVLVNGTLESGLGGSFSDYIEVNYQGKVGKISRLIVAPVN